MVGAIEFELCGPFEDSDQGANDGTQSFTFFAEFDSRRS